MPYIGNNLATQFQAFATQTITGDGSTGYTLDRAVANGKELLVYINNVKQEEGSGKSYTASGTTITFSEAVASGDSCYLVYMGSAQQTVTAPDGSIVSGQIANATLALPSGLTVVGNTGIGTTSPTDTNGFSRALDVNGSSGAAVYTRTDGSATNRTVFANSGTDGYVFNGGAGTLRFYSNATQHMTIDANGHITKPQTPAFCARGNYSTVSVNDEVWAFNSTSYGSAFNIGSHYNTSDGKFTAPIDGRYFFHFSTIINTQGTNLTLQIRVNNSATDQMHISQDESGWNTYSVSNIYNLSANDYVTVYVGGNYLLYGQTWSRFTGYLLG